MSRAPGVTLAEMLTVLAVISVATGAALTVTRNISQSADDDRAALHAIETRIALIRRSAIAERRSRRIAPADVAPAALDCGGEPAWAFADGSVSPGAFCLRLDDGERRFRLNPLSARLESAR